MSTQPLGPYGRPIQDPAGAAAPAPPSSAPSAPERSAAATPQVAAQQRVPDTLTFTIDRHMAVAVAVAVAAVVSGLGPWITLGPFSRSGIDAGGDAIIAMALGVAGGLLLAGRRSRVLIGIVGTILVVIAVADVQDVMGRGDALLAPSPGWGLYLVGVVGIALVVSALTRRRG